MRYTQFTTNLFPTRRGQMTKADVGEKILKALISIEQKLDEEQLEKIGDELTAIQEAAENDLYKAD
jgi:hypothetical protein